MSIGFLGVGLPSRDLWQERLLEFRNDSQQIRESGLQSKLKTEFSEQQSPEIAVIISLYKSDRFLLKFIQNLEGQTSLGKSEICIISVEPSTFERTHLHAFAERHSNVILEFNEDRTPIYVAWNRAIGLTSAPIITNANADDIRSPNSLEIQIDAFKRYPWADVIYQDVIVSYDPDATWDELVSLGAETHFLHVFHGALLAGFNYPHNAPAWKRSVHETVGLFNESYLSAADGEFWLRCSEVGKKFFKVNSVHSSYYLNPEGLSSSSNALGPIEHAKILAEFSAKNDIWLGAISKSKSINYESKQLSLIESLRKVRSDIG
jgi:glycosyltransferase involved in cell wall biosynthesis